MLAKAAWATVSKQLPSKQNDEALHARICRYLAVENHSMTRWAAEMNASGELPSSGRPCLSVVDARNGVVIQVRLLGRQPVSHANTG